MVHIHHELSLAMDRVLTFIHGEFHRPISREEMAQSAGLSIWYFSKVFKEYTGVTPNEYVTNVRMASAKKQLLFSSSAIQVIAEGAGYPDEFYFSRKFKQSEHLSPRQYRVEKRSAMAALALPFTGHLLSLGVIPHVATVDSTRDLHLKEELLHIPVHLKRSKQMSKELWHENLAHLREAEPGLILCPDLFSAQIKREIEKIAPTIIVPWLELTWREHLQEVAELSGKKREAVAWLKRYQAKTTKTRQQLKEKLGNRSVSLLHVMGGQLVIYGKRNVGAVLYEDLGLTSAYNYEEIDLYKVIEQHELSEFLGDQILVVVDRDVSSYQAWQLVKQSSDWQKLRAVEMGKVQVLKEMPWLDYSPYAHEQVVDLAVETLCK
ncbi:AraC family transcriptional regulator [Alkalicoccobacillus murimartini]|uniref:AraC-like DNA-binding protein/ABC-type enterochelin transport system substrate-binding protein n=1 Tax=Alkalicoccobacillus murimartini TaxID=171685 RepID=A0ABT9YG91_9BACI|nr:AraC family transcriptional regulator [Alkalicoccobacillus murimartini]MDQ0206840.1 AraC-like DNA-binding protein/ABC-type enterochelin transport system substrate-binding protein [Alkalicoccobacillus murimartini]